MLSSKNLDKFRAMLVEAVDQHLANGGKLISGSFYNEPDDKQYCPVSCLVGPTSITADDITAKLGARFTDSDLWLFVDGFDGQGATLEDRTSDLYKLGQELRAKYIHKEGV